jgi:hypothetical protein
MRSLDARVELKWTTAGYLLSLRSTIWLVDESPESSMNKFDSGSAVPVRNFPQFSLFHYFEIFGILLFDLCLVRVSRTAISGHLLTVP